ncbi:MAG: ABC transporter ATP-binding protein [Albidovulum sp.]|nr:ABC transporter ATP-binding protein [Albidovulum sp.]
MNSVPELTLQVADLRTHFFTRAGLVRAVDGVSFTVRRGEIVGIVGESGSGKSVTGFSIMGLVDKPGRVVGGRILFRGTDLVTLAEEDMRKLRGNCISMIFQDASTALNPVVRVDTQLIEAVRAHRDLSVDEAREIAIDGLKTVGIPAPEKRMKSYPHEFSGGMRQRLAIALAIVNEPDLIIADEPTTALDVSIQAQILHETQKLCRERGTSLVWITHDLTVVAGLADHICVMYAGRLVESGPVNDILDNPQHPYTSGLIGSIPSVNTRKKRLFQIPGMAPPLLALKEDCAFRERCSRASEKCAKAPRIFELGPRRMVRCFHPGSGGVDRHHHPESHGAGKLPK